MGQQGASPGVDSSARARWSGVASLTCLVVGWWIDLEQPGWDQLILFYRRPVWPSSSEVPKGSKEQQERADEPPVHKCFISICVMFATVSLAKASCMTNFRIKVRGERPGAWICRRVTTLGTIPARICPTSGLSKGVLFCPYRECAGQLFQGRCKWRYIVEFEPLVSLTHL